jgi:hypothetical protein
MSLQIRNTLTHVFLVFRIQVMQLLWMQIAARMAVTVLVAHVCGPASEQVLGAKRVSRRVPHSSLKHTARSDTG